MQTCHVAVIMSNPTDAQASSCLVQIVGAISTVALWVAMITYLTIEIIGTGVVHSKVYSFLTLSKFKEGCV